MHGDLQRLFQHEVFLISFNATSTASNTCEPAAARIRTDSWRVLRIGIDQPRVEPFPALDRGAIMGRNHAGVAVALVAGKTPTRLIGDLTLWETMVGPNGP
jgi:hypothetical protein